jgi:hypothetical protein
MRPNPTGAGAPLAPPLERRSAAEHRSYASVPPRSVELRSAALPSVCSACCPMTGWLHPVAILAWALMFVSSSTFSIRLVCWMTSRASCLRVRVRSRTSWIGAGGTKLPRTSPCARRSESHVASLTSDFRPGTLRTCCALASTSSNEPSSMCHTGFQYTPVASMTTCVQRCSSSQVESSQSAVVVVANERTSCVTRPSRAIRAHATTTSLCTSSPAHLGYRTSMSSPRRVRAGVELASSKSRLRAPGPTSARGTVWGARGAPGPTSYRVLDTVAVRTFRHTANAVGILAGPPTARSTRSLHPLNWWRARSCPR